MPPKSEIMRRGGYKCRTLEMHLQLKDQQLKTISYIFRLLYQNFRATANKKSTIDTQTKKNQLKYNTNNSHQTKRGENKRRRKKKNNKNKPKIVNKMAIRIYISIITLNVNGLNAQPKDIDWLHGYKNKIHIYTVFKRPTSVLETSTN